VSTNCETELRPSAVVAVTSRWYVLAALRPGTVSWCVVLESVAGVHTTGVSRL
jgi:hypothetical protein